MLVDTMAAWDFTDINSLIPRYPNSTTDCSIKVF